MPKTFWEIGSSPSSWSGPSGIRPASRSFSSRVSSSCAVFVEWGTANDACPAGLKLPKRMFTKKFEVAQVLVREEVQARGERIWQSAYPTFKFSQLGLACQAQLA